MSVDLGEGAYLLTSVPVIQLAVRQGCDEQMHCLQNHIRAITCGLCFDLVEIRSSSAPATMSCSYSCCITHALD